MSQTLTTILSFLLPCLMTTLGGVFVFFFNKPSQALTLTTTSFAAGIMLSASIWSLLLPAFEQSKAYLGQLFALPVAIGFVLGAVFVVILGFFCKKCFSNDINAQKPFKFFSAMTIHNIPEGLSVGIALGSTVANTQNFFAVFLFALGIALQNFPEGLATALAMQNYFQNSKKSFFFAFLSGIVEPIFAIVGYFLAKTATISLPFLLSLSAGAMIFVVVEELMPEMSENKKGSLGPSVFIAGFLLMMILDICL